MFFAHGSTAITPEAQSVLDNVAAQYASMGGGHISVAGSSDRAEAASQPAGLSLRRAEAVKNHLMALGVAARSISVEGFGATRPRVPTADGVREPQNRNALIEFRPAGACPPGALAPKTGDRVFALPPPRPSDFANLAPSLFRTGSARVTYGDIEARLSDALERAGYPARSYYATCGGFAMVTRVERVRTDGRPFAEPRRFVSMAGPISTVEDFTIAGIIRALTNVSEGRFRVLVFLVTDQLVSFTDDTVSPDEAERWVVRGTPDLSPTIGAAPAPATFYVKALVYEFRKTGDRVEFVRNGPYRIAEQLRRANFQIRSVP